MGRDRAIWRALVASWWQTIAQLVKGDVTVDARIRLLLKIIEERGGTLPMSSEQIGSLLGLGEARVLRLFTIEVGKTLRRHVLEVRMSRAAALLGESMLPIKLVAHQCGYSAVNNFYRDFRKVYGTSPLQMRLMGMDRQLRETDSYIHLATAS
jgi:transcriptional regulator GlxA family with amidase domain